MLRRSGGNDFCGDDTTRSPTRISPAVGSTKPATRRSVVVLPQPEGPSRHTGCRARSAARHYRRRPAGRTSWSIHAARRTPTHIPPLMPLMGSWKPTPRTAQIFQSGSGEDRLALFHEGLAALFIIAALEAGVHGILRALEI